MNASLKNYFFSIFIVFSLLGCGTTDTQNDTLLKIRSIESIDTKEDSTSIKWELNSFATGQVEYGKTDQYGNLSAKNSNIYKTHTVSIDNLTSATTYHYRIISTNIKEETILSEDNTFTTLTHYNRAPTAVRVEITGSPKVGEILSVRYDFYDSDGDKEGDTIIVWSTPTKELQRGTSKTYKISKELISERIRVFIFPVDTKGGMSASGIRSSNEIAVSVDPEENEIAVSVDPEENEIAVSVDPEENEIVVSVDPEEIVNPVDKNEVSSASNPKLVFKSGFNNNVNIFRHYVGSHFTDSISGIDTTTGFTWPDDLPGDNSKNRFNYLVKNLDNLSSFADASIVDAGINTKALRIETIADDPTHPAKSRVQYNLIANQNSSSAIDRLEQVYMKYRIKISLEDGETLWRNMMEWYGYDLEWRWTMHISKMPWINEGEPIWRLTFEDTKGESRIGTKIWEEVNKNIAVPLDEWFDFEIFWKLSSGDDGRVAIAINGQIILEHLGQNKLTKGMKTWNPFKAYGQKGVSLITNVEFWNDIPIDSILSGKTTD